MHEFTCLPKCIFFEKIKPIMNSSPRYINVKIQNTVKTCFFSGGIF